VLLWWHLWEETIMPATTTLKLPAELKERITPLAESAGKSPHAWMVEALEQQAVAAEKRHALVAAALAARAEVAETGLVYRAEDVHAYLSAKAGGAKPRRPKPVRQ
jgi:predicted transcriptional regulator